MSWFTYIIKSTTKRWYYVGSTNDLKRRINEHNLGYESSTRAYKPFIWVLTKEFLTEKEARAYEQKLKKCRILKETIIREYEAKNIELL